MADEKKPVFIVNGIEVGPHGKPLDDTSGGDPGDLRAQVEVLTAERDALKARVAELERVHEPDDADTRTVDQLKAALDAAKVEYPKGILKADLVALAAQHGV